MTKGKRGGGAEGDVVRAGNIAPNRQKKQSGKRRSGGRRGRAFRFAALDLGTNNCRLLIAVPKGRQLRIVDAFSRIVRLGEGLSQTGVLSDAAMVRTISALRVCAEKIRRRGVTHIRCIATQACRGAANGETFLENVRKETGLAFDIISTEEEARLAVSGCEELLDENASAGLIFDIGGGSTELSWIVRRGNATEIAAWTSLPFGVVSLSEKWGGREIDQKTYATLVDDVRCAIAKIGDPASLKAAFESDDAHLLGTSGTVTSIAGVHLRLPSYRRDKVDGLWLSAEEARNVAHGLRSKSFQERANEPCIGEDRADLVLCGCAILEALLLEWPASRIRVADRGLREGILTDLSRQARKERKESRKANKSGEKN